MAPPLAFFKESLMSTLKDTVGELFANEPDGRIVRVLELADVLTKLQARIGQKHRVQPEDGEPLVGTLVKVSAAGCHFVDDDGDAFVTEAQSTLISDFDHTLKDAVSLLT